MSVQTSVLPGGLRVVTDHMAHAETASIVIHVDAGSRNESAREHGLSHLLEHMAFKGTKRRNARTIVEEIESAGGELNAGTSTEHTVYQARVLGEDTPLALDILADILTQSLFDPAELEREKSVILQEISAVDDTPDDLVFDLFNSAAFGDQPIGRAILGTPETVQSFSRADIAAYLARHYHAGKLIVAAAGNVDHKRIVEDSARLFAGLETLPADSAAPAHYTGGDRRLKRRDEQANIVIGFEGLSHKDDDSAAAAVFSNLLGGGMSSRLFQEVREERGLAYSIDAFHWPFADTGLFGFHAATSANQIAELVNVSLDCIGRAVSTLDAAEVARAVAQMKVAMFAARESSSGRAEQLARQWVLFDRILTRDEVVARLDALSVEDVRRAARRMIASVPTVSAIGPIGKVPSPDRIAERLKGA